MIINDKKITAKEFAWDTCHKIYLIETKKEKKEFKDYGYEFFPIKELKKAWEESCSLKFISHGNLDLPNVVNQFETAKFI